MAQPQVRVVSSLGDVDQALQDLNINNVNQVGLVRFELHERASLKAATMIDRRTRPGRLGFKLVNPELLECKTSAKTALENSFNSMLDASIRRLDQEMHAVEGSIGTLRALVLNTDDQMPHNPPESESHIKFLMILKNSGTQQLLVTGVPRGPSGRPNSEFWRRGTRS